MMAIIVKMPAPRARSAEAGEATTGATILFFTGVRYERDVESFEDELPSTAALSEAVTQEAAAAGFM